MPRRDPRRAILRALLSLDPVLSGSLSTAYTRCGKQGCRCARGRPHGPSHRLILRRDGQATSIYVPGSRLRLVRKGLRNRRRLERLLSRLYRLDLKAIVHGR